MVAGMLAVQTEELKAAPLHRGFVQGRDAGSRLRRLLPVVGALVLVVLLVAGFLLSRNWPFTKQAITSALQDRSARKVEIGNFRQTFFPPGCVAENVRFLRHEHPERPPIITINKMIVEGSYARLLTFSHHVPQVHVIGMRVTVPPREPGPDGKKREAIPLTQGKGRSFTVGNIVADGALLEFMPGKPGADPYRVQVQKLELGDAGGQSPMSYRTTLALSSPPSEIQSTGSFGPWNPGNPGKTPVSGSYTMVNAKLGVYQGIAGTLSSKGSFSGPLEHMRVEGTADVPDFHVTRSNHTLHLSSDFSAVVNGTDGDTALENVKSNVLRSTVASDGSVAGRDGQDGKTAALNMTVHQGHIEDLLLLLIKAKHAPISGIVSLHAKVELPPGPVPFLRKLRMDGDFGIGAGKFANTNNQSAINKISESARGETKKEQEVDPQTVLSDLKGHAVVRNGIANLSNVSFRVAGALAVLSGTYNLINQQINLHGTLETNGKLSDATTGFKSLALKVITPFFKKKSGVRMVPFKITGTYGNPNVALDVGRKK